MRTATSVRVPTTSHAAKPLPSTDQKVAPSTKNELATMTITVTPNATTNWRNARPKSPRFHAINGPMAITTTIGTMRGINTALKNGGPTDTLPPPTASRNNGYSVPKSTAAVATVINRLLSNSEPSRDTGWNMPPDLSCGPRTANRVNEPPTTSNNNARINTPRAGSEANECTEDNTPERTIKVPKIENENATMDKKMVQPFKALRFSTTIELCSNAVPTSHGMNEAFSTGSQNHQPPQPSS